MRRKLLITAALCAALLATADPRTGRADGPDAPINPEKLPTGMPQAEVRKLLGPPKRVARQILYRRYLEQWIYDGPKPVRIEFDCVRGKEPQILTVHPLTPRP
jgi:hypothetical protein